MNARKIANGLTTSLLVMVWGAGCAVTSPTWDHVPASINSPIPFSAWTTTTSTPVVVECANDTNGHGWPTNGESSYIFVGNLSTSNVGFTDSEGSKAYPASGNYILPGSCWKYFSYGGGYWQANIRVSQVIQGKKRIYSSFDKQGLTCLTSNIGTSWYGWLNKGCQKKYSNTNKAIPYIILRIFGYNNGLNAAQSAQESQSSASSRAAPATNRWGKQLERIKQVERLSEKQVKSIRNRNVNR